MKKLRVVVAICVLAVCLSVTAKAGEILTPGVAPPPPPTQPNAIMASDLNSSEPSVFDALYSETVGIFQSLALLIS
jgi:hypothetical protein